MYFAYVITEEKVLQNGVNVEVNDDAFLVEVAGFGGDQSLWSPQRKGDWFEELIDD